MDLINTIVSGTEAHTCPILISPSKHLAPGLVFSKLQGHVQPAGGCLQVPLLYIICEQEELPVFFPLRPLWSRTALSVSFILQLLRFGLEMGLEPVLIKPVFRGMA